VRLASRSLLAGLVLALAACAESYPGGGKAPEGTGGAGGEPDDAGFPVHLPAFDLQVRSQLWAPQYARDGLLPGAYTLVLLDQARACENEGGLRIEDGEAWLQASFVDPALGSCDVRSSSDDMPLPDGPPPGCHVYASAGRSGLHSLAAKGGTVRIDRLDATVLAGELRLQVVSAPVYTDGCGFASGGGLEDFEGHCSCDGPDGPFVCTSTGPADLDCCDDGLPLVEVVVPFAATRCPNAGGCGTEPCAPYLVGSCRPAEPPPPSCEDACEAYAAVCRDCLGCADEACCVDFYCEREGTPCDPAPCLTTCRNLAGADPLVALSLACVEAATTCDDWSSCLSACGPAPGGNP
jgi:hypothetical protein